MFQCGKARCKICQFIEPGSTFVVLLRNILSVLITILTVIHKVLFTGNKITFYLKQLFCNWGARFR